MISNLSVAAEYKGAFFLAHAIIMVSVGLPLSYLLTVIGQFSGSGVLQGVWKTSFFFKLFSFSIESYDCFFF